MIFITCFNHIDDLYLALLTGEVVTSGSFRHDAGLSILLIAALSSCWIDSLVGDITISSQIKPDPELVSSCG